MNKDLSLIRELIDLKYEGGYWDYKQNFSDNIDLIHDIICMANNLEGKDAYIFFGIADNGEIIGLKNNTSRKNQADIITLLKDCKFAGDIRPEIRLETIKHTGHDIDILTIKNTLHTPYFLTETKQFQGSCVNKHHIYTRIGDTNTPKNMSADIDKIEILWRKRFFLDKTPLERLIYHVKWSEWDSECENMGECNQYFCKIAPEFTVDISSCEEDDPFGKFKYSYYSVLFNNIELKCCQTSVRYYGTVLKKIKAYYLDGGRYSITHLDLSSFKFSNAHDEYFYRYYVEGELPYLLVCFLDRILARESSYLQKILEVILLFANKDEQEQFHKYLLKNQSMFEKIYRKHVRQVTPYIAYEDFDADYPPKESTNDHFAKQINTGKALNEMLVGFKNNINRCREC